MAIPGDFLSFDSADYTGRFKRIIGNPPLQPNKCVGCGKVDGSEFIEYGQDIDFYGIIYFCASCITEAASLFGTVSKQVVESLQDEIDDLVMKNKKLEEDNGRLISLAFDRVAELRTDLEGLFKSAPKSVPTTGSSVRKESGSTTRKQSGS